MGDFDPWFGQYSPTFSVGNNENFTTNCTFLNISSGFDIQYDSSIMENSIGKFLFMIFKCLTILLASYYKGVL